MRVIAQNVCAPWLRAESKARELDVAVSLGSTAALSAARG